jgi:hypothetical protein
MHDSAFIVGAIALLMPTAASAALKYEPGNYAAQDNLVVNFDGIRNAGLLKAHDGAATEWKNIGRVANDAEFIAKSGDTSAWVADGYHFAGGAYGKLKFKQTLGASMTVQIVADVNGSENSVSWPTFFGNPNDKANIYLSNNTQGTVSFKADNSTGLDWKARAAVTCGANVKYLNAALNANEHKQILVSSDSFATGWKVGTITETNVVGSQSWSFGSCGADGTFNDAALGNRYLVGTIKAIRVYNKVLSDAELAANRVIDEARFFAGIPVTNVVVATAVAGLEGNEGSGAYAYDDDGYTFTAPQKATKDGTVYACAGYTLETWNGTGWSAPVRCESCAYTATDPSAKVRLTWQWQRAHAEVPVALDPLFDEYVTDGLILHLDGIRNVGADKPHSWSSPQWIDLVKGNIASFQHDYADTSTWMDDGYYFGGRSFAQFVNALSGLAKMVTVQVVCDTTTNALHALKTSSNPNILWPNLVSVGDNDQLNIYYDMNGDTRSRLTFKNANGGNVNLANGAAKDAWEGRYVTAIRNGAQNYILQTTAIADAVQVSTDKGNIAANTLRVGGANSPLDSRNQRWFLGTIKAVRIYDRVLSDAELAQNRAIDEARFFGGPLPTENVVVASSVRGVDGNEPEGVYALPDGGHTFTAPASVTVGEDSYSCTGYTLETWDTTTGTWGTPTEYPTAEYVATDKSAKVRLTWQWEHTAGPGYDAAFNDYVTDGLIVHLDGIRNTGAQAVHDSGALQWADLANPGGNARLVIPDADCGWRRDGYYFDGKSVACYAIMNTERTLGAAFTAQAVLDFDCNNSHRINTAWPGILGTTATEKDYFAMYYNQNNSGDPGVCLKVDGSQVRENGFKGWKGEYVTGLSDGTKSALFQTVTPDLTTNMSWTVGTRTFTFCGGNGDGKGYTTRRFNGIGKAARIYGRALTNAELERNRAADEVRFFGRSPAATGDLVVASTVEGLGGGLPCGAYRPAAGYTFTAQTEAVLDGVPYELKGYTLETWDGTAWANAETGTGSSVTPNVSTASKRLTWNWVVKSRLTKIKEYDVGDYIQDGLYLFYDGIRNAGKDVAHNPNATEWVNLGAGDKDVNLNAVFDYASNASAGDGWEADGYRFKYGGKFAKLASDPKIDWKVTIQVVCEAEKSGKSGTTYPTYFGSTNDYLNVYGFAAVAQTIFKIRNNSGDGSGRMELAPNGSWQGKYLNAIWHAGKYQIFQNVVPVETGWYGSWRKWWTTFSGQPFYIGGVYMEGNDTYVDERRLTGKIQAIRVYNRSLLDEELEHNRMVDEARFKGNPPECNVTIATKYGDGTGETLAEGVGNYKVEGSYTFSATTVRDFDDALKPVGGYYLETYVDGAWIGKTWREGNSFMYDESQGKVRITWSARKRGLVLILR